jgi:hypothetical protein
MKGARNMKQQNIRFPDELRESLKKKAEENMRSLNNEILIRLQESLYRESATKK